MQRIAIIDYGSGNLHSAAKAFERAAREAELDCRIEVTQSVADIAAADRLVLPGVGAFADCRAGIDAVPGLREAIELSVREAGRPFLGICVGMQLMASRSLEHGVTEGFGWIAGDVVRIEPADGALKIPHMGWNTLRLSSQNGDRVHPLFEGIEAGDNGLHAYFVHSYHLLASSFGDILASTDYGGPVTAAVGRENFAGTQFHPEKSQTLGLRLIANFLRWRP